MTKNRHSVSQDAEAQYRLCEVVLVKNEEGSIAYKLTNGSYTRRRLNVRLGAATKTWQISSMSNTDPSVKEIDHWKRFCEKDELRLPSIKSLEDQLEKIDKAVNFVYDDSVVDNIAAGGATHKQGNFAIQRDRIDLQRSAANERGDKEAYNHWTQLLHDLEAEAERARMARSELEMIGQGVSHINKKHKQKNRDTEGEVGQKNSRERYALVVEGHADLYLRRPTRNNCYFDMPKKKSDRDKENADKNKDKEDMPPPAPVAALSIPEKNPSTDGWPETPHTPHGKVRLTDLEGKMKEAHSFDLGIDIDALLAEETTRRVPCPAATQVRHLQRTFNSAYTLQEYQAIKNAAQV